MKLSVIIPTLDEEASLPRALASVPPGIEIVVADGQSRDRTVEIATRRGTRLATGARGRGAQMNLGARVATGEAFLFLHADCELGPGAEETIRNALRDPNVVGGSFRLRIARPGWSHRVVAFGANLRARFLHLPYGDQAIFVRRSDFEAIGGYPEIPLMEDVELVRKLRRRGDLVCLRETVTTEPRHWEALGPLFTTLLNWVTISLFFAGASPARLAPFYHRLRKAKPTPGPSEPWLTVPND